MSSQPRSSERVILDKFVYEFVLADESSAVVASAVKLTYIHNLYNSPDISCKHAFPIY